MLSAALKPAPRQPASLPLTRRPKAGQVHLIELRFAAGLGGKAFVTMTGEVSSVQASVDAGVATVGTEGAGPVLSHIVIPSPSEDFKARLLG